MPPPVAVYVVAAVVGFAALYALKEFVYEPHIAPRVEAWAEDFLERRRAARNRRASGVPVRTSRRRRRSPPAPSDSSHHNGSGVDEGNRPLGPSNFSADELELEALVSNEVDEWRNEVLRSQEKTEVGLRRRRTGGFKNDFDGFESTSTTLDESFTSLTHTPLASTHVISNVSSPITPSTLSPPMTPTRRFRSGPQSTTTQAEVGTLFVAPQSPPPSLHEMSAMSPTASPGSAVPMPRSSADGQHASPSPLAIPIPIRCPPLCEDDSPFGPLLPDTPRSSAEMYGKRPFSPITRTMGSSSSSVSTAGSKVTIPSRTDSTNSVRTLSGSGVLRKRSGLVNEVTANGSDDDNGEGSHRYASTETFIETIPAAEMDGSAISSLSERYPAPPTPPVVVSPPASSIGVISAPSSPGSGGSEVMVHHDAEAAALHSPPSRQGLPTLQLPSGSLSPGILSRSRSSGHSAASPALSYVSFFSPIPISRGPSESEGDEFLSVISDGSDWSASPMTRNRSIGAEPAHDRANNPFFDFEHLAHGVTAKGSELGDGSEGSEVLVSDLGQEGASEVGSDESWGSAKRH